MVSWCCYYCCCCCCCWIFSKFNLINFFLIQEQKGSKSISILFKKTNGYTQPLGTAISKKSLLFVSMFVLIHWLTNLLKFLLKFLVCPCSLLSLILFADIKDGSSNWSCYFNFRKFIVLQMYHIFTLLVLLNDMVIFAKEYFVEALIDTFILYHHSIFWMKINLRSVCYLFLMYSTQFSFFSEKWQLANITCF